MTVVSGPVLVTVMVSIGIWRGELFAGLEDPPTPRGQQGVEVGGDGPVGRSAGRSP